MVQMASTERRRLIWSRAAVSAAMFFAGPAWLSAQTADGLAVVAALEQTLTQTIEHAEPSVVSIARWRPAPPEFLGDGIRRPDRLSNQQAQELLPNQFAAGVILAAAGTDERFVLTAYHAVRGGAVFGRRPAGDTSRIDVRLSSRHACSATIYAADPRSDLAVLKLDVKELGLRWDELRPMQWPATAPIRKGQFVVTLANPYWIARDGSSSVSWGIIANVARRPAMLQPEEGSPKTLQDLGTLVQVDYRLPIGASGAPVLNLRGELLALCSSIAAIEGYERSGGFAIPLDRSSRWIVETLLQGLEVEYGLLGIAPQRMVTSEYPKLAEFTRQPTAAMAQEVQLGSSAHLAGVQPNDVILAIDGEPTLNELELMRQITLHPPEATVQLTVYRPRSKEELTLHAKLGKWPVRDDEGIVASQLRQPVWRGLQVDYPTGRERYRPKNSALPAAVLITDVAPDSPAHIAGLQAGEFVMQVNRTNVKTPSEFAAAVKSAPGPVTLRMTADDPSRPPRTVIVRE